MATFLWKTWSSPRLWKSEPMTNGQPPCPAAKDAPGAMPGSTLMMVNAPPSWRCIDFISDLHLHEGRPHTFEAFKHYLQGTPADALFILGDLFEAWVGDDMRHQPFEQQCTQVLAQAGRTLRLHLMVGNRDFLLGQTMSDACHARLLDDPTVLHAFGQRHVLTHGDAWCLADTDYLAFRAQVRSNAWQAAFLAQPLPQRLHAARAMRNASEGRKEQMMPADWVDVDASAAAAVLSEAASFSLVHGHTHRPASEPFARPGAQRHVLSDWELDGDPHRAEVLRLTASGFARFGLSEAIARPLAP